MHSHTTEFQTAGSGKTGMEKSRVMVCITGASGSIYGVRLLRRLKELGHETHVVITRWGAATLQHELAITVDGLRHYIDSLYDENDMSAGPASGSFPLDSMIVVPCSMKTLASVAHGLSNNLITRVADCSLKENRPLVLVPREAPYNLIHLRNMMLAARAGAVILPASPPFWSRPNTIEELVDSLVDRMLVHLRVIKSPKNVWSPE